MPDPKLSILYFQSKRFEYDMYFTEVPSDLADSLRMMLGKVRPLL
jgi:hypothetical protein